LSLHSYLKSNRKSTNDLPSNVSVSVYKKSSLSQGDFSKR